MEPRKLIIPVDPNYREGDAGQFRIQQGYVMGLAFTVARDRVVLIHKTKPPHLAGKWNGIGGKIEQEHTPEAEPELPIKAMAREYEEETGVATTPSQWEYFGCLECSWGYVLLYRLFNDAAVFNAKTTETEIVQSFAVNDLPDTCLTNTRWLVGVALDPAKPVIHVQYEPGR